MEEKASQSSLALPRRRAPGLHNGWPTHPVHLCRSATAHNSAVLAGGLLQGCMMRIPVSYTLPTHGARDCSTICPRADSEKQIPRAPQAEEVQKKIMIEPQMSETELFTRLGFDFCFDLFVDVFCVFPLGKRKYLIFYRSSHLRDFGLLK